MEKIKLTQHQEEVFELIIDQIKANMSYSEKTHNLENRILSLTGPAGTGKSFLTAKIIDEIYKLKKENSIYDSRDIYVTAPTHKAKKVIDHMLKNYNLDIKSQTIHSYLNLIKIYDLKKGIEKFIIHSSKISYASLLIVDESSMISKDIYKFIIELVEENHVNTVLFIGDFYQLLPINQGFNDVFKLKKQYSLSEIVRQKENNEIIKLSTKIRDRIASKKYSDLRDIFYQHKNHLDIEFFNDEELFIEDFCKNPNWYNEDKILTSYTNKSIDNFNKKIRNKFWLEKGIINPASFLTLDKLRFKKSLYADSDLNHRDKTLYVNSDEVTIYNAVLTNDMIHKLQVWNCKVLEKPNRSFNVLSDNSIKFFQYKLEEYKTIAKEQQNSVFKMAYWKKYFRLKDAYANVQYIFASTIHKLQGSTYDTVYIDLSFINNNNISKDLLYRLIYVAITRARKNIKVLY